ncbi:uncharacterized protein LOC141846548 [Curcuma longa]|uniref:uncharacterized protein LOC141846548 n=1 Tax=Curcuma longa TaxID=136217 RepID=UPI003D9F84BB
MYEMGVSGRPLFDLNELPEEEVNVDDCPIVYQPQKSLPVANLNSSTPFPSSEGCQRIQNNHSFTHAPTGSGFQLFKKEVSKKLKAFEKSGAESNTDQASVASSFKDVSKISRLLSGSQGGQEAEREEGEWSDRDVNEEDIASISNNKEEDLDGDTADKQIMNEESESLVKADESRLNDSSFLGITTNEICESIRDLNENHTVLDSYGSCNSRVDAPVDGFGESSIVKLREVRGVEASHALRFVNNPVKRPKIDEHKEAMLGKKRTRQTVFINVEDAKQASPMKPTPKRQTSFPAPNTRIVKDSSCTSTPGGAERPNTKNQNHSDIMSTECNSTMESVNPKSEPNGDVISGGIARPKKLNHNEEFSETYPPVLRQGPSKQSVDTRHSKNSSVSSRKPPIPGLGNTDSKLVSKRNPCNDPTSHAYLQGRIRYLCTCINYSGRLTRVFRKQEPFDDLLASMSSSRGDECSRTGVFVGRCSVGLGDKSSPLVFGVKRREREGVGGWDPVPELTECHQARGGDMAAKDSKVALDFLLSASATLFAFPGCYILSAVESILIILYQHDKVSVLSCKISPIMLFFMFNSGWYDAIVLPVHECKWNFKEGDIAVLAYPQPGGGKSGRRNNYDTNDDDTEHEATGRVVGTVRRHIPSDTRYLPGAIFHFYAGDLYGSCSTSNDHILRKLEPKSTWYLTTLGSLATTQREYIALHAFRHLNGQMQSAILKPSPEHFPKYEDLPPAMSDCFTQNFVDYLRRTFNPPQLAAIQWAAMHTASGTNNRGTKRQDPWPFTLVQGPPGTGKTHTVWGMLNVIHLVQYQHYYTALLKKLAPESYKQTTEVNLVNASSGSIDEVLQNMDQSLLRTLPKLCPKPRMLVCAPSNAATDELLARVLDRGFIDGEMKVYRPDVARVGVDSQTRASQAVSVERRTEQLLQKGRDEVLKWLHDLKRREADLSQQISHLQRDLIIAAAAGMSQGSVGVDPDVLAARDQNRDLSLQHLAAALESRDKVLVEISRLVILESKFRSGTTFNMEDARANLEASFANEAEIVFTTVSSSGRKIFSRLTHGFDMVVIDEAAQASEVAVLPPLSLGAARCVLVGDPQQLPATVISKAAGTLLYSRSLFERFQQAGCPTLLLSVQYRMHPQIRDFPSRYFYQGRLTDSESIANLDDEVYYRDSLLHPYAFFDITHGRESHRGGSVSYQNVHEAQFSLRLYEHLQKFVKSNGGKKLSVGIITPYKLQLKCLQREFDDVLKSEEGKDIYINTVDAFQGQERDVIIMSCVRASNHGVGFVADIRRMNVALTRARRALWVVGNANALMQSEDWAALVADAKSRKCFIAMESIPKEFLLLKGSSMAPAMLALNSTRSSRSNGQRKWHLDALPESKSGTQSEDEDKSDHFPSRNGSYRNLKMNERFH